MPNGSWNWTPTRAGPLLDSRRWGSEDRLGLNGAPGDYQRCIVNIQAEVSKDGPPLGDRVIHGLCATLHKLATGATPGHAPGESHG